MKRIREIWGSLRDHPFRSIAQIIIYLACFPAFYVLVNFYAAVTPEQSGFSMPDDWEAGVMNHGHYYQWYTIEKHPLLYWSAISTMVLGVFMIIYTYFVFGYEKITNSGNKNSA